VTAHCGRPDQMQILPCICLNYGVNYGFQCRLTAEIGLTNGLISGFFTDTIIIDLVWCNRHLLHSQLDTTAKMRTASQIRWHRNLYKL